MSSSAVVTLDQVSKSYRMYSAPQDRLKQFIFGRWKQYFREFWALEEFSLSAVKGDCLGIVGRNGSGKSTALQIIAGTVTPTSGEVKVIGRVSALLELGAGFHPEFTGRENVALSGALMGLSSRAVRERMDAVEEFAGIGEFIDQPVKTYSSGMYVRLAFSSAIHVDPDILIVDEALAVGDAAFQYKCLRRIEELRNKGMTILFVSHDLGSVRRFCNKAVWIHEGRKISEGLSTDVVSDYENYLRSTENRAEEETGVAKEQDVEVRSSEISAQHHARLCGMRLVNSQGAEDDTIVIGSDLHLQIEYEVLKETEDSLVVGAAIFRNDELYVFGINSKLDRINIDSSVGVHTVDLRYPSLSLLPGKYYFKVGIFDASGVVTWDFNHQTCPFSVVGPYIAEGLVVLPRKWNISK